MEKDELSFENFLMSVNPVYHEFVNQIHDFLLENGCKIKIELAKNGYLVSYSHIKSKRAAANFVFRKNNLIIRIYGDHVNDYIDFMNTLPDDMLKAIGKAPVCKRLIDINACNSRCPTGYDFTIGDMHYQKCRYNSFMFEVNSENIPFIKTFIENEIRGRASYTNS